MSVTCRAFGARTLPAIVKAGERVCWEHSRRSSPPGKYGVDGIVTGSQAGSPGVSYLPLDFLRVLGMFFMFSLPLSVHGTRQIHSGHASGSDTTRWRFWNSLTGI